MLKRTLILLIALTLVTPALSAKRIKQITETKTVIIPVYDTIRVTITDTIRVEPKPAPRIDTLRLAHSPAEIDSLVEQWSLLHLAQSEKRYFDLYDGKEGEATLPIDTLYKYRLMDIVSPVHLPYNHIVRNFINQYLSGRWSPLSSVLSLSKYYFPIIEEELIKAGLPVELRFLPIIESNLSIRATSHMGAVGLWQFMPATGKNLGLEINSLVDERCDVVKSTRAACRFLAHL